MNGILPGLLILSVVGCAPIHWRREDGAAGASERAQFHIDNSWCRAQAQGGTVWAVGSVPGAWGIRARATYRSCMTARGYLEGC